MKKYLLFLILSTLLVSASDNCRVSTTLYRAYLDNAKHPDNMRAKHLLARVVASTSDKSQEINARIALQKRLKIISIEKPALSKRPELVFRQTALCEKLSSSIDSIQSLQSHQGDRLSIDIWDKEYSHYSSGFVICDNHEKKTLLNEVKYDEYIRAFSLSDDEKLLAIATDHHIELWDIVSQKRVARVASIISVNHIYFSNDTTLTGEDHEQNQTINLKIVNPPIKSIKLQKRQTPQATKLTIQTNRDYYKGSVTATVPQSEQTITVDGLASYIDEDRDINALNLSPNKKIALFSYGNDGAADTTHSSGLLLYDMQQKEVIYYWDNRSPVLDALFFNDQKSIALVDYHKEVISYKKAYTTEQKRLRIIDKEGKVILFEALIPDGDYSYLTINTDQSIILLVKKDSTAVEVKLYDPSITKENIILQTQIDTGSYLSSHDELRILSVKEWGERMLGLQR